MCTWFIYISDYGWTGLLHSETCSLSTFIFRYVTPTEMMHTTEVMCCLFVYLFISLVTSNLTLFTFMTVILEFIFYTRRKLMKTM